MEEEKIESVEAHLLPSNSSNSSNQGRHKKNKYALGCGVLASMTSVLMGYHVAVISGAQKYMQADLNVSDTQIEILNGILNLASLFGSFAASYTSDRIGRRATITIASAIFFVGSLIMTFATSFLILMVGRFVTGIAVGFSLMIAPVYTSEIAPTSMRGLLSSLPEVFINSGILLSYVSNLAFSGLPINLSWRIMFGIAAIPPAFLACGILTMPESPRWLVMKGRLGEARHVLVKTSDSPEEVDARLRDIKEVVGIPLDCSGDVVTVPRIEKNEENIWKEMFTDRSTPAVKRIIFTVLAIQFFQQASGTEAVVLYTPRVLEKAGLKSDTELLGATILVGLAKLGFILVATFTSDRLGRRLLFLLSAGGMVISYIILGLGLEIIDWTHEENFSWAAVVCILAVVAVVMSFSIGLGPLAWVYSSEILPLRLRGQGASLGTVMNRTMSGVVAMTFISLYEAITVAGSFFLFAGITAMGWVFIYFCLPETKGRSLEDIEVLFEK
ncbi:polyol transporter 5-like protein [Carex littledalei]|uniref:Polyol transporter 5-like protein n=1 Tax=Carex littledalei TaxID=544730 RepID=A0A833VFT6_9POAL|nr:polyol transporter 5-like protein [Carex littledalei]